MEIINHGDKEEPERIRVLEMHLNRGDVQGSFSPCLSYLSHTHTNT